MTVGRGRAAALAAALVCLSAIDVQAGPFAYLPVPGAPHGAVHVVDTVTNSPRFPVPVGEGPCGIALDPTGSTAYVANCLGGTVTVIDTRTSTPTGTLLLGVTSPCAQAGLAVHPSGRFLYVAGFLGVAVIDLLTGQIETTVPAAGCALALAPAGDVLYVDNVASVDVVSTLSDLVIDTIPVPCPFHALTCAINHLAVHPAGTFVYATHKFDAAITVIDAVAWSVVTSVQLSGPVGVVGALAVHPAGTFVYVARVQESAGDVAVIDAASLEVVTTVPTGSPSALEVAPGGGALYVARNDAAHTVVVVDTATRAITGSFSTLACQLCEAPGPPAGLAIGGPTDPPSLLATVNQPLFGPGQVLSLAAGMESAGVAALADFYAGVLLPGGESVAFLAADGGAVLGRLDAPASFVPAATGVSLAAPISATVPGFIAHRWTGDEPRGDYAFFLLAVRAGAVPGLAGPDVLGLAVASFAFP